MSLRDLDAKFKALVLGGTVTWVDDALPKFHADLGAVWQGVEKLTKDGWSFALQDGDPLWLCSCGQYDGEASTPALAILKACLLAKGVTEQEIKETEEQ
jgi:hypothetical protein